MTMRKIHYNVMRFRDTLAVDEAEVRVGRYRSVRGRSRTHMIPKS